MLDVEATRQKMEQGGSSFVLPAQRIVDRASFFEAVRATVPLDPPVVSSGSWDALADSLWEGLYTHPARRTAIIWSNARAMEGFAPVDFETALDVLADVASLLADCQATRNEPKEVMILVE